MTEAALTSIKKDKKLHIMTWGCQMNVYDSTKMADLLSPLGFSLSDDAQGADLVILNTCHIREKASEKIFSELGRLHKQQKEAADTSPKMIAVAGCVAQAEGEQILARAPYVDMVFGPQTYHRLPEMVAKAIRGKGGQIGGGVIDTDFPAESKFDHLPMETTGQGPSAFLSVQEGCDKFCTFCVVPYTRGAEYSRPVSAILAEAQRLIDSGAKEISLLGQNVNAYHGAAENGDTWGLGRLIEAVAKLNIQRIRYTTSHPKDMDEALIAAHRDIPQLMPFMHLPVQSGSNIMLEAMNRKHTRDDYMRIIEKTRAANPDIAFSSDFIVGFPNESDKDFEATLQLIRDVNFAQAYSFKYSERPGTPAAKMAGQIPEDIKTARLAVLQELLFAQQRSFNERFIGKTVPVLFDRHGKLDGQLLGRTPHMQSLYVQNGKGMFGQTVNVKVEKVTTNSLERVIV
ncbi:MAG: tRNA (N6-isopentenyl adenosine(37)-C2)-methylthiotransferase MiaB [Alphaproteobacteria bacterium]|nr:tRNA (N6-isopentenyl adenosine(37)-C2)-methylthiotransferase MiaB [Alphaproteobacteria bacterium]